MNIFTMEDKFVEDALILDIDSTDYYDLILWLNRLEIDTTGNIEDLKSKLYDYYELTPVTKTETNYSGRSIIIESARMLNYLKDIEIDQNLIVLEGQVILKMIDPANKSTHKIMADKIIFNQTEKTISAFGHIQYEISGETNNELFYGESLVFEIENWEGIFFEGVSENDRIVNDKNISFFFSGDYIYRSNSDKIILNHGSITSSRESDPYYRLDAQKIWVLQPGEWAIKNAVLYVGRIPMLYIPFFFLPGDKLVFNPSVGYKETSGYFINTTTFLLGQKDEAENDTFSFLKSNNNKSEIMKKKRNGLFLTETDSPVDMKLWPYNTGSSIKLLGDFYSRKGFFVALDGKLEFTGFVRRLDFLTAFSLSRYLFLDGKSNTYTPYRTDLNGNYISDIESSYFLGKELPFRFAFDVNMDLTTTWLNFNFSLPVYSDGQFRLHFLNREEGLKWTEFLEDNTATGIQENEINNLIWKIQGSVTPSLEKISPLIEELSVKKFNVQLTWLNTYLPFEDISLLSSNEYTLEDNLSFFYPSTLTFPDLSLSVSGTIFTTAENNFNNEAAESLEKLLINPISDNGERIGLTSEGDIIKPPEILTPIPVERTEKIKNFANTLKYSFKPSVLINSVFNTTSPLQVKDTEYVPDYSIFNSQITSIIDYSFNIRESLLEFRNKTIFSMNFKQHFNPSIDTGTWESLLLQDKNATNYKISDNITIQSKPFSFNSVWSESVFNYSLNTVLLNRYYNLSINDFTNNYFMWNESSINNHKASFEFRYKSDNNFQLLKLETILPPGTTQFNPEIVLTTGKLTGSAKTGFKYNDDGIVNQSKLWSFDPVFLYLKYAFQDTNYFKQSLSLDSVSADNNYAQSELFAALPGSHVSVNQNLQMNINNFAFTGSSTTVKLWFFNINFLMEDVPGYDFILPSGWIPSTDSIFQPSKASAGVDFSYNPDPFWKNRVRLSLKIKSSWTMNLQKYTDTSFNFGLNLTFSIAEFLDLTFDSNSVNRSTYRYIPGFSEDLGLVHINPFVDLLKSFNFFNTSDRLVSNFNIETIGITAVHHLSDWDLSIKYTGKQDLVSNDSNRYEYIWKSDLSIFLTWRPIPEIKKNINYSENEISFK